MGAGGRERGEAHLTVSGGRDDRQRAGGWSKLESGGLIQASTTCQPPMAQWRMPRGLEREAGEAVLPTRSRQSQILLYILLAGAQKQQVLEAA